MAELKCPHCKQVFTVDDTELSSIVQQIRDKEFEKDLNTRVSEMEQHIKERHALELVAKDQELAAKETELKAKDQELAAKEQVIKAESKESFAQEIEKLKEENQRLQAALSGAQDKQKIAVMEAQTNAENTLRAEQEKVRSLQAELASSEDKQKIAVLEAVKKVEEEKHDLENALANEKTKYDVILAEKNEQIEFYKNLKAKMSTKMVGETLEQHCEYEFNRIRMTAFPNAQFGKDNQISGSGSKGDYIYREYDENGVEIISIMFEMKNEVSETATKHKNESFLKELDKDRREKNCEYAVLVSTLEADNELYNAGIVDVSYMYEKMYVVRPQCFIPIITILRTAAMNALSYKQELAVVRNQNIDISNFEDSLMKFKDDFGRNYEIAHNHFDKAIDEIDKTISHLEKVKKELMGSDNQLRIANSKVEDVTVKKLTKNNPTMKQKFDDLKKDE